MKNQNLPEEINLETLLDVNTLQQFQDMISKITGVAALIINPNGNPITHPTNFCKLCNNIIGANANGKQYCRNLFLSMKDQSQNPYIGTCPYSNLLYAYIDIRLDDKILATWVIGQVREKSVKTRDFTQIAEFTHTGIGKLMDEFLETSEMRLDQFYEIAKFINLYTEELICKSYQMFLQSNLLKNANILEEQLFTENTLFNQSLMSISEGIILLDNERKIQFVNPVAEKMVGWKFAELKGKMLKEIIKSQKALCRNEQIPDNPENKDLRSIILYTKDGLEKTLSVCITIIKKNDSITGIMIHLQNMSEEQENKDEIIYISNHDALTGLFNRGYFEYQLKKLDEEQFFPLSVLMGDVNGLKFTNDVYGHYAGDHLLFLVSEALKKNCPKDSVIARWGGDEFVVLMPNKDERTASAVARNIYNDCFQYDADKLIVSISFGYATKIVSGRKLNEYLITAEDLMYKNKTKESKLFKSAVINKIESRLFNTSFESLNEVEMLKDLSRQIAPFFHLSETEIKALELLAQMHDYGEIAINSYLLEKPSRLSEQEWKEVRKHPEIGYRIINTVTSHLEIGELILTHHECWNGNGYPMGISQNQIPLLSRIFSVIDSYTAMTSKRPYRNPLTKGLAIDNLIKDKEIKYDPQVIDIFVNYLLNMRTGGLL